MTVKPTDALLCRSALALAAAMVPAAAWAADAPVITLVSNAPGWVTVYWEHDGEGDSYRIERKGAPLLYVNALPQGQFTDVGLQPDTVYEYRACVVDGSETSCSDWTPVRTMRAAAPPPPATVPITGTSATADSVTVRWGATGTYSRLQVRLESGYRVPWQVALQAASNGSYSFAGLWSDEAHMVRVRGCNWSALGEACGAWSSAPVRTRAQETIARAVGRPRLRVTSPGAADNLLQFDVATEGDMGSVEWRIDVDGRRTMGASAVRTDSGYRGETRFATPRRQRFRACFLLLQVNEEYCSPEVQRPIRRGDPEFFDAMTRVPPRVISPAERVGAVDPLGSIAQSGSGYRSAAGGPTGTITQGSFDTPFGVLTLHAAGGTYGNGNRLTVTRVLGNIVEGVWEEPRSNRRCADGRPRGRFRFAFNPGGFTGNYGYCEEPLVHSWRGARR